MWLIHGKRLDLMQDWGLVLELVLVFVCFSVVSLFSPYVKIRGIDNV